MGYICLSKRDEIFDAVVEAERFLLLARIALEAIDDMNKSKYSSASSKEVASAKRASMDLTRKLAAVRK